MDSKQKLEETIFGHLSPEGRALIQRRGQAARPSTARGLFPRDGSVDPLPLSFEQQSLWLIDRLSPGLAAYHIPVTMQAIGSLDVSALHSALDALVVRHESLRTTFDFAGGKPIQIVGKPRRVPFQVADLANHGDADCASELRRLLEEGVRRPFDLASDLMLRGVVVRLGPQEHVLQLVLHHIAADGWSVGILLRELGELYRAFSANEAPTLAPLPIQYADFALWERQQLQAEALKRQIAFWRRYLAGAADSLALPTDRRRPPLPSFRGSKHAVFLPEVLTGELKALGQRHKVTLFMTLLAAFKALLARYSGQDDVVVGSPTAGRNRVEVEGLIGFFVSTLPLRTDLSGDPTFRELLGRIRESTLDALAHKDLPLANFVEELKPGRSSSQVRLFQVLFALEYEETPSWRLPGLVLDPMEFDFNWAKFDLSLTVSERSGGLRASFNFDTDLFDTATIERMGRHFRTLLEGIVADPGQPISKLPLLSEDERHQLIMKWNDTARGYPADRCLHQLFEEQVARTPDAVAVVFENQQLTYRELNARSNQLAHYLRDLGVGPEVLVGICVERSLEMVVGLLGVLKAGGAYVPLDPEYPAERLAFLIRDSAAPVLLTQKRLVPSLPDCPARVLCLDADASFLSGMSDANPPPLATPDSLAYVIYTSGSTGVPKGVLVSHDNVVRLFRATQPWFNFDRRDVWTLFHSFAFDFSVWEIWGALVYGGRLVVVPSRVTRSPHEFYQLLVDEGVTVLNQTPSAFRPLVAVDQASRAAGSLRLRLVIFGGEALELESLRPWFARHGDRKPELVNMYGITETTVHVTYRPLRLADLNDAPGSVIGRPIPDLRLYVLESNGQPAPVGVPGEICVGGAGVARGYLNRPEATAQKFIPDPFGGQPDARLYRSGDLARFLPDGDIEYLGRIDQQVKIRGYRIELGEIEAVLGQHPQVRDRVVVARQEISGENRLVAYVVSRDRASFTYAELRAYLKPKLPAYMIPSALVVLDALPLTANGKLDRRALPEPRGDGAVLSGGYTAPRTEVEERLARLWAEALRLERVGIHDNFFEIGGDSLMATGLFARIEAEFGQSTPLAILFRAQTIADLAGVLTNLTESGPSRSTFAIGNGNSRRPPLFVVHGMDGDLGQWRHLMEHLGSARNVYGLKLPGENGVAQPFTSIEALAGYHVDRMCNVQPEGPYHVAGYSFGAKVALEIAQQLLASGRLVGLLGSIDSAPFWQAGYDWPHFSMYRFGGNMYYWVIDDLLKTRPREMLGRLSLKLKMSAKRIGILPNSRPASSPLSNLESWLNLDKRPDQYRRLVETSYVAWQSYVPKPYAGNVTLFRARARPLFRSLSPDLGWGQVARDGVDIRIVPGHHWSIMTEPHVRALADHVRDALEKAEDRAAVATSCNLTCASTWPMGPEDLEAVPACSHEHASA
jgi:amino acid adenylation domain-containing protein